MNELLVVKSVRLLRGSNALAMVPPRGLDGVIATLGGGEYMILTREQGRTYQRLVESCVGGMYLYIY